ncbi:MAG: adenosylcobinamide-GDP ribazoletransferase [Tannerellaceae bacterium]|jgi:adenosylcobinamide-GDP ribazoletransferase|nr:adenosylcobinamide-GDP ribazoletransferase [Tannerellaceae bacterium]
MNRLLASCIFFTRLPFWRLRQVPAESFRHVLICWPLTGWLTGGLMGATLWLTAQVLPLPVAALLAIAARIGLSGALHEDGLADFLDGFGGGRTREQTLAIMKDSGVGTYGVVGLILYFLLLWALLSSFPLPVACWVALSADAWSKAVAAQLANLLPYARKQAESKSQTVYERMSWQATSFAFLCGLLPLLLLLPPALWWAGLLPPLVLLFLWRGMKKRLQAYTGDCCGATFLLCELSFYLAAACLIES